MTPETIASLTTAGGTLVLAVATFASVRSANRASRLAERSLQAGVRPMLVHARLDDSPQKIGFADDHWIRLEGNQAAVEERGFGLLPIGEGRWLSSMNRTFVLDGPGAR